MYQTNPMRVLYEGPIIGAKGFYDVKKEECFVNNRTLGIRISNSYHFEWPEEMAFKAYGFTGVNPETGAEYFVVDFDHEYNQW